MTVTAQFTETLRYQGRDVSMCTEPLGEYFSLGGFDPGFVGNCSALWRGYQGHWEIVDDRLYLIGLRGTLVDGAEATLATVFPDFPNRVFAHWYSGTIRLSQGNELEYVHAGYGSIYERDVLLDVDRGVIETTRVRHNASFAAMGDDGNGGTNQSSGETGEGDRGKS
jgi:hypothetical protein